MRTLFIIILALLIACPGSGALAMSSSNFTIPSDSMDNGGSDSAASANFKLNDSIGQTVAGPSSSVTFNTQQGYRINSANPVLSVAFVDGAGATIISPTISFNEITVGTVSASGQLGSASARVHVINTRTIAPWSVSIAATAGPTANWSNGANSMSFDQPSSGSALTVNPTVGAIAAADATCNTTGLTLEPSATFNAGIIDSITLLTADAGAQTNCAWDLTNIGLLQTIPTAQTAGSYSISMTITVI